MNWQEAEAADNQQAPAWGVGKGTGIQLQRLLRRLMVEWSFVWVSTCHSLAFALRAGLPYAPLISSSFRMPDRNAIQCFFSSNPRTKPQPPGQVA